MPDLAQSFEHCRRIAKTRARNFYYSFLLLPNEQKDAMCAVYAFMRYCDDISDEGQMPPAARRHALARWRKALERALTAASTEALDDDPILPAFRATVRTYEIPEKYFFDMIDGVGSDLEPPSYAHFDELYGYCYRVASVVGLTIIHILGFDDPRALQLAEKCGIGFQLTNILRDVAEDAAMGRVYLPGEDLARFGLSSEDLLTAVPPTQPEGLDQLVAFEWKRAQGYYEEAAPLLGMVRPSSRPALWAMMTIYYDILMQIRTQGYDVYRRRARLSTRQKGWIVLRATIRRWLGGALPFPA